jgi:BioD-like phosphotransacetylase family protein
MVASPDFVLALKLAAKREKDVDDVVLLVNRLGIKTRKELIDVVKRYFNADLSAAAYQREQIEKFIDQILEEGLLEFPNECNG